MEESTDLSRRTTSVIVICPDGEFALSTSMTQRSAQSASSLMVAAPVGWSGRVLPERRSGARPVSPSEDVGKLARFCF